ncbi:MAG: hypothetical protein SGJ26_20665 [Nitrospirota bacterium]|nr:hypothetical protein [Nitrospirota bacterium]
MSIEKLFAQTPPESLSGPRGKGETRIAPTLLPACCVCGLIRDETRLSPDREHWVTQRAYRETHGVSPIELALTHTYCPTCFEKAQDRVRQFFRKVGTPP